MVTAVSLTGCGGDSDSGGPGASTSSATAEDASAAGRFLRDYVTEDGRVLRHDQGGDIVSEGQAYAMLIAQSAGRDALTRTIWTWTRAHLQRPDGLLAFHANAEGKVLDDQAAADADTLAAYALLRARGPGADSLHADGRRLAGAVLEGETFRDPGRLVLAAGPWAVGSRVVNPSYSRPGVFADLARSTQDARWRDLAGASVDLVGQLTRQGMLLPPDWARLEGGDPVPAGQGGGDGPAQYGPDAQRVPMWFAACTGEPRRLAGGSWAVLQQDDRSAASTLTTDGQPMGGSSSTVALLASAAAAQAAGDTAGASQLRQGAEQTDQGQPSYYGSAWLALSQVFRPDGKADC
jgi:endoglucanase